MIESENVEQCEHVCTPAAQTDTAVRAMRATSVSDEHKHTGSIRSYTGQPRWLPNENERREQYRQFLQEAIPQGEWRLIRDAVQRGPLTGAGRFVEKVEAILGKRIERPSRGRPSNMRKDAMNKDLNKSENHLAGLPPLRGGGVKIKVRTLTFTQGGRDEILWHRPAFEQ